MISQQISFFTRKDVSGCDFPFAPFTKSTCVSMVRPIATRRCLIFTRWISIKFYGTPLCSISGSGFIAECAGSVAVLARGTCMLVAYGVCSGAHCLVESCFTGTFHFPSQSLDARRPPQQVDSYAFADTFDSLGSGENI